MEAVIGSGQEEMKAVISSTWGKLEESMKYWVEAILVFLHHRTQGTQAKIEAMKTLVDTMWQGLKAKIAGVTDDFLKGLETARHEFKTQLAEVEAWGASRFN
jgi:ribosomal protein L6P/L9E